MKAHGPTKKYITFFLLLVTLGQLCHAAEEKKEGSPSGDYQQLQDLTSAKRFGRASEQYDVQSDFDFTSNDAESDDDEDILTELTAGNGRPKSRKFSLSNAGISEEASTYLRQISVRPTQVEATTALHKELSRTCLERMRPVFFIEPCLQKIMTWCCLSKTKNLSPRQNPQGRGCCNPCIWPRNNWLPSYNAQMTKWVALADNIDKSTRTAFGVLWTPIFNVLMLNDIYNYFAYPGDRGGSDLLDVLLGEVDDSVLASFTHNIWFWCTILGVGSTFVVLTSVETGCTMKSSAHQAYIEPPLQPYRSTCWNNTCGALLPFGCGKTKKTLTHARRLLLWDANLTVVERKRLLGGVIKIAQEGHLFAKRQAIGILSHLAYAIALENLSTLKAHGMTPRILASFLNTKERAQSALRSLSKEHQDNLICCPYPCSSFWGRIESAYIYFITEESLWKLGYKAEQPLVAMFFLLQAKRLYNLILFFKELYDGGTNLYDTTEEDRCHDQGYYYSYFPEDDNYHCTVCGDFQVPFQSMFTRESCWQAFLSSGQTWDEDEINRLMDRIDLESMSITDTDFSNLGLSDEMLARILEVRFSQAADEPVDMMVRVQSLEQDYNELLTLDCSNNQISNISLLTPYLSHSNISSLVLSRNRIKDIRALVDILPTTSIISLDVTYNQITDIIPLVRILPDINLISFSFSGNPLGELIPFVKALLFYHVEEVDMEVTHVAANRILYDMVTQYGDNTLDLSHKQINNDDLTIVTEALPIADWQNLSLCNNQISDPTPLANTLLSSSLTYLDLSGNNISNITAIANVLPSADLISLYLNRNQISDITTLAQALYSSPLTSLYLSWNGISSLTTLTLALPSSQLTLLDLSYNNISDITEFSSALPSSTLRHLYLSYQCYPNPCLSDIIGLASALPFTTITYLDLIGNKINDITPLASVLPSSALTCLYLSYQCYPTPCLSDLTSLASTLPSSTLRHLDLGYNNISDLDPLATALPSSTFTYLDLSGNRIIDITAFSKALPASNLTSLFLSENQISNLTALADVLSLSSLRYLFLRSNQFSNIIALANALPSSSLISLDLSGNQISYQVSNIIALASALPSADLTFLFVGENQISDITPFATVLHCASLISLDLHDNQVTHIALLSRALPSPTLTSLDLSYNNISDITSLASSLPSFVLTSLNLGQNQISNLTSLANILSSTGITHLDLSWNHIRDLTSLASALYSSNLKSLDLSYNNISNLTDFAHAIPSSNLEHLNLIGNNISDVNPFVYALCIYHVPSIDGVFGTETPFASTLAIQYGRPRLSISAATNFTFDINLLAEVLPNSPWTSLYLPKNAITNITLLAQALPHSKVKYLDLTDNNITDIGPLFEILSNTSLKFICLRGNQIRSMPTSFAQFLPYASLNTLDTLDLSNNKISDTTDIATALRGSNISTLYLAGNLISNIEPLAEVLPETAISTLDLRNNHISNITLLAEALPHTNLTSLNLANNQIDNIIPLSRALPNSLHLTHLDLSGNRISNIGSLNSAIAFEHKRNSHSHSWFRNNIHTQDKSAMSSSNCPSLTYLNLANNTIHTADAIDFCMVLPITNINEFSLVGNEGIDTNVVDPYTCRLSAAPRDSVTATFALVGALVAYWLR